VAMDTPLALKQQFVPGSVYEIYAAPLLSGLSILEKLPTIQRVSLTGDHLRVILQPGADPAALHQAFEVAGVAVQSIKLGEPGLEDVFMHLAKGAGRAYSAPDFPA